MEITPKNVELALKVNTPTVIALLGNKEITLIALLGNKAFQYCPIWKYALIALLGNKTFRYYPMWK